MSTALPGQESLNLLNENVTNKLKYFRSWASFHQKRAFILRLTLAALSATVTVLLGIKSFKWPFVLSNLALVVSGALTVLTAWEAFWNNRELWLLYQDGASSMNKLKSDISYATAVGGPTETQFADFRNKFDQIVDDFDKAWRKARSK